MIVDQRVGRVGRSLGVTAPFSRSDVADMAGQQASLHFGFVADRRCEGVKPLQPYQPILVLNILLRVSRNCS